MCRTALPSDQPANCSRRAVRARPRVGGAASSRLKPTTPSTCAAWRRACRRGSARVPGGEVASVRFAFRGRTVTVFDVDSPLPSVGGHGDLVPGVGRCLAGRRDRERAARPVSGPANGWKCVPWCSRTSVLMSASLRSKPAASLANALYVIVSPARYSAPSAGAATVSVGGDADLDDDRLSRDVIRSGGDREADRVHALAGERLRGVGLVAGGPVAEVPRVGQGVAVGVVAAGAREVDGQWLGAAGHRGRGVGDRRVRRGVVSDAVQRARVIGERSTASRPVRPSCRPRCRRACRSR